MIFTYTLIGLVAAVAILVAVKLRKAKKVDAVAEARKRAEARVNTRAFADTQPDFDPYRTSVQFQTTVLPPMYNPDLTETQARTIGKVLGVDHTEWYAAQDERSQFSVSGYDIMETIELCDPWKSTTT